jgi:hypothetical protein
MGIVAAGAGVPFMETVEEAREEAGSHNGDDARCSGDAQSSSSGCYFSAAAHGAGRGGTDADPDAATAGGAGGPLGGGATDRRVASAGAGVVMLTCRAIGGGRLSVAVRVFRAWGTGKYLLEVQELELMGHGGKEPEPEPEPEQGRGRGRGQEGTAEGGSTIGAGATCRRPIADPAAVAEAPMSSSPQRPIVLGISCTPCPQGPSASAASGASGGSGSGGDLTTLPFVQFVLLSDRTLAVYRVQLV